jgi:hypothetical protein
MTERDSGPVTPIWSYRVSRYDPALRDAGGAYLPSTWTSWSDIGRSFDGVVLLEPEYLRAEDGYLTSARRFMEESGVESLAMQGVENHSAFSEPGLTIAEGASVAVERDLVRVIRLLLREHFWCRLESAAPSAFVHVGYDFYMYIGVARPCPRAIARARSDGLFVEVFPSPYRRL